MKLYPGSLRKKILVGYTTGVILIFAFALLSWNNLSTLQEMISSGEVVTDLFDTTLEVRRFEKNYFLYGTYEDYIELLDYIDRTEELLERPELLLFTTSQAIAGLQTKVQDYSGLLKSESSVSDAASRQAWERTIRERGKEIVNTTGQISNNRDVIKQDALQSAKEHLLIGIALILASGLVGGLFFYSKAVKPLSVLEKHMVRIADGEFSLIPVTFKDRELKSLKAAFNRMLIELQKRQKYLTQSEKLASLGTLIFGVAHELNNPISNISTSTQILKEEIESDDLVFKRELLDQIETETDRARDVVGSLLDFSRSKVKKSFPLKGAVAETIRFLKAEVPANISIRSEIPDDITIYADKQKIQHLILNLIKNAMDAIEGEGVIRLTAVEREGGRLVEIGVFDNGAGMEPEALAKIFDPFYTSKQKGHGLGLFIVHNVVKEHGGNIGVASQPGVGTTFTITLPAKEQ